MTYGPIDIAQPQPDAQVDLAKAAAGGLDAQFFSIFVLPLRFKPDQFYTEATRQIDAIDKLAADNPKRLRVARTAADVRANAKAGVMSALYGLEGGHALLPGDHAAQLEHLRALAARGVRYMTLTWINGNDIGGSSGDASDIRGLTPFGAEVDQGDEPAGRRRRRLARLRRDVLGRGPRQREAGAGDALVGARADQHPAQHDRRDAEGGGGERRRRVRELRIGVPRRRLPQGEDGVWAKKRTGPPWEMWQQIRADAARA